jgi:Leucine-rich repeat (LRR) protein
MNDLSPISGLNHLQILYISKSSIRDISILGKLKNLKNLSLRKTVVSDEQIDELQKALPDLKIKR